ncbi:MAG: right-handed parallel beta-helix repeat-containing protein [Planctomycetia bacterium]|nr:right-handed parallel beta-helix repeat-containing protein [Planctomycetia bacterium]
MRLMDETTIPGVSPAVTGRVTGGPRGVRTIPGTIRSLLKVPGATILAGAASVSALVGISILAGVLFLAGVSGATEYYVDPCSGDDMADGRTPSTAWRSSERVSDAELRPGDVVKFRRIPASDALKFMYRGTFRPKSGTEEAPIHYTWYGDESDPKPIFCNSVPLNRESDWRSVEGREHLWKTRTPECFPDRENPVIRGDDARGGDHTEGGAQAVFSILERTDRDSMEMSGPRYQIAVSEPGTAPNHIQWYTRPFSIEKGQAYRVTFGFRTSGRETTKPVLVTMMKSGAPWSSYSVEGAQSVTPETEGSPERVCELIFTANRTTDDARINISAGGLSGSSVTLVLGPVWICPCEVVSSGITTDVGNLILARNPDGAETSGYTAGWKKWSLDELTRPGDFWCDLENRLVYMYCDRNPAQEYTMIEAAMHGHVVSLNNLSHAVFDGLDIRFGTAHGFGGTNAHHVVIRNCDISWTGGADQYLQGGTGRRVRFGNGIEFWATAHDNLVENNRIWEIYDAAITNQGSGKNEEVNITYRGNEIWNCEYSFEFWNRGPESVTRGITFTGNRCRNAGYGWGHVQRPDRNGRHLMFYNNSSQTSDFRVSDNEFTDATESLLRMDNDWTSGLSLDRNTWSCDATTPIVWWMMKEKYFAPDFDAFRKATGYEQNGVFRSIEEVGEEEGKGN